MKRKFLIAATAALCLGLGATTALSAVLLPLPEGANELGAPAVSPGASVKPTVKPRPTASAPTVYRCTKCGYYHSKSVSCPKKSDSYYYGYYGPYGHYYDGYYYDSYYYDDYYYGYYGPYGYGYYDGDRYIPASKNTTVAQDLQRSTQTYLEGKRVNFVFSTGNAYMQIKPSSQSAGGENEVTFDGRILDTMTDKGYNYVEYKLNDFAVRIYPKMYTNGTYSLAVTDVSDKSKYELDDAISGPWMIESSVDKEGLVFCFDLPSRYTTKDVSLVVWDGSGYKEVDDDEWRIVSAVTGGSSSNYLKTEKLPDGVYAVVSK